MVRYAGCPLDAGASLQARSRASCSNRIEADEDTPGRRHCSIRAMSRSRPRIRARGAVAARSRSTSEAHRREGLSRALRFNSLSDEDREDTECRPRPGWQSGARRPLRAALSAVRADRHLPPVEDARGDPREGGLAPGPLVPLSGAYLDSHSLGQGVDFTLNAKDGPIDREKTLKGLFQSKFGGIVEYRSFVHADGRTGEPAYVDMRHVDVPRGKMN